MLYANYETPVGRTYGQTEVHIHDDISQIMGMPIVDYDSLDSFVNSIVKKKLPKPPQIFIKNLQKHNVYGYYDFFKSRRMYIDPILSEFNPVSLLPEGAMTVVAHEARHLADFAESPLLSRAESVLSHFSIKATGIYTNVMNIPYCEATATRETRLERRAYEQEAQESLVGHTTDILFPRSIKTHNLIVQRKLSSSVISQLGREDDIKYGYDYPNLYSRVMNKFKR